MLTVLTQSIHPLSRRKFAIRAFDEVRGQSDNCNN
jgi:hypothetical protein